MYSSDEIKEKYERFDNASILRIAVNESRGLRDEAVTFLIDEIKKRNLDSSLIDWINAERRLLSTAELSKLKNIVKSCRCCICQKNHSLFGYEFKTITSILIEAIVTHQKIIVCQGCGENKRKKSAIWSAIFGWWSMSGIISTPFILVEKIKALTNEKHQSDTIIEAFILENIGTITINHEKQEVIQELLNRLYFPEEE
ncbi:MAG: hypothetical protein MUC59_14435 [Saprospiraceae bacterium]|nr:hypothetical protein [Saprospiraceae bacterium]